MKIKITGYQPLPKNIYNKKNIYFKGQHAEQTDNLPCGKKNYLTEKLYSFFVRRKISKNPLALIALEKARENEIKAKKAAHDILSSGETVKEKIKRIIETNKKPDNTSINNENYNKGRTIRLDNQDGSFDCLEIKNDSETLIYSKGVRQGTEGKNVTEQYVFKSGELIEYSNTVTTQDNVTTYKVAMKFSNNKLSLYTERLQSDSLQTSLIFDKDENLEWFRQKHDFKDTSTQEVMFDKKAPINVLLNGESILH